MTRSYAKNVTCVSRHLFGAKMWGDTSETWGSQENEWMHQKMYGTQRMKNSLEFSGCRTRRNWRISTPVYILLYKSEIDVGSEITVQMKQKKGDGIESPRPRRFVDGIRRLSMQISHLKRHELLFSHTLRLNCLASAVLKHYKYSKRGVGGISSVISPFLGGGD